MRLSPKLKKKCPCPKPGIPHRATIRLRDHQLRAAVAAWLVENFDWSGVDAEFHGYTLLTNGAFPMDVSLTLRRKKNS